MSMKEKALNAIEALPPDADFGEILEKLNRLAALQVAERQSLEGKTISHSQVKEELDSWAGG